ncbi:putative protein-synthesizing GTPase [Helianthus anomalus]
MAIKVKPQGPRFKKFEIWTKMTKVPKPQGPKLHFFSTYNNKVQCTVLEVKVIEGLGTTIDVVLVNGVLHEGDEIVGAYIHHKEIKAAQGIKIIAQLMLNNKKENLEHAVAGTALYSVELDDDVEEIKKLVMDDMRNVMSRIDTSGEGVYVHASTLGSLEALLDFLKTPAVSIPVSGIGIGHVHKKDVMKASVMLEKKKEFAAILAFDVKVTPEAQEHADDIGVKIFIADIIYHLFNQFKAYIDHLKEEKKREAVEDAVFPCVLRILPKVFNKRDPIILGVDVIEGILKTPFANTKFLFLCRLELQFAFPTGILLISDVSLPLRKTKRLLSMPRKDRRWLSRYLTRVYMLEVAKWAGWAMGQNL